MSDSLRVRWQKQLEVAQAAASWRSRGEVRVLRFLLARYEGQQEDAVLSSMPLYESEPVHGRAKLALTAQEQGRRLGHITQCNLEKAKLNEPIGGELVDLVAQHDLQKRRRWEAFRQLGKIPPRAPILPNGPQWLQYDVSALLARTLPRPCIEWGAKSALVITFLARVVCSRR